MTTEQATAPAAPQLTLGDLTLTLNVIQACAQRGAFKAEEMTVVGGLYDRIYSFLDASGALKKPEAPVGASPVESAADTEAATE